MKMRIHKIPRKHVYCGPSSLIAITGYGKERVENDINIMRKKPAGTPVVGKYDREMSVMLKKYGFLAATRTLRQDDWRKLPTLTEFLEASLDHDFGNTLLIGITGHYVLVRNGIIYDTKAKSGKPIDEHPFKRSKVRNYWVIIGRDVGR
jgi:hypothetical protein